MRRLATPILAVLLAVSGCDCGDSGGDIDSGAGGDGQVGDAPPAADARPSSDADNCEPPDMLVILDRTMSMHRRPDGSQPPDTVAGHMESKWYIAINALEAVTAALDETIRFGLELFPVDPADGSCVTLSQRITGTTATNTQCEGGEVPVSPAIDTAGAIDSALDPETTLLCRSTPIGAGLATGQLHLQSIQDPVRDQLALLITDGQDTCGNQTPVLDAAHGMAAQGVKLFVIGFDGTGGTGVDHEQLNDLACAGRTAPNFPAPCTADGSGNYSATDPSGARLYILAGNASELQTELEQVAGQVCCNCVE